MFLWTLQMVVETILAASGWLAYFYMFWPIHQTFHATRCQSESEQNRWLSFWIAMTPLLCLEYSPFVAWVPGYDAFKLFFMFWLASSKFQGAEFMYKHMIFPFLASNEAAIDEAVTTVKSQITSNAQRLGQQGMDQLRQHSVALLVKGHSLLAPMPAAATVKVE